MTSAPPHAMTILSNELRQAIENSLPCEIHDMKGYIEFTVRDSVDGYCWTVRERCCQTFELKVISNIDPRTMKLRAKH
jgi:hypothetical protein